MPASRLELRRRLFRLAAEQGGYFSAAQAKAVGYTYQAQAYHVEAGNWMRIARGIFRLTDWVPNVHDDLARWTLWSRGRAVVSHETALAVHGIGEFEARRVNLTVPPGFSMRDPGVTLHRAELPDVDVADRTGFKVTTPTRSLIDIAAVTLDDEQLGRAIQDAREAGLISIRTLRARAEILNPLAALRIERAMNGLAT